MKKRTMLLLLIALMLLPTVGLATEITEIPDTYEALLEMMPELFKAEPEVAVRFPTYSEVDEGKGIELYCDNTVWVAAQSQTELVNISYEYDDEKKAYVLDEKNAGKLQAAYYTGLMTGFTTLANEDESGWRVNVVFYHGQDAIASMDTYDGKERTWDNVTDFSNTNYLMPNIVAQLALDNGTLQVWQYADHTIALLRDKDGAETARQTYTEYSEFCANFMPLAAE